jgi:hypothetical protein
MFTLREIFYNEKLRVGRATRSSPPALRKTLKPALRDSNTPSAAPIGQYGTRFERKDRCLGALTVCEWPSGYQISPHLDLGKTWRDQKLVANQDNKKYIAATVWAPMAPRGCVSVAHNRSIQKNGECNAYPTFRG